MKDVVVDRRVTLAWLASALATPALAGGGSGAWKDLSPAPVTAARYGTDPNLVEGGAPWPLTLTAAQRETLAAMTDTLLPGAAAAGVPAFIDEWISAPYDAQRNDRPLVLSGLAWIDADSATRFGKPFARTTAAERARLFDLLTDQAKAPPELQKPAAFFAKVRSLTVGAYYTSEAGIAEIGYVGNEPIDGDYPGPTPEALAHLETALASLNLKMPV